MTEPEVEVAEQMMVVVQSRRVAGVACWPSRQTEARIRRSEGLAEAYPFDRKPWDNRWKEEPVRTRNSPRKVPERCTDLAWLQTGQMDAWASLQCLQRVELRLRGVLRTGWESRRPRMGSGSRQRRTDLAFVLTASQPGCERSVFDRKACDLQASCRKRQSAALLASCDIEP